MRCDSCGIGMRAVGDDYICENAECRTNSLPEYDPLDLIERFQDKYPHIKDVPLG